jgi:hypothetical protein
MPTPTHHPGKDIPVIGFLALAGALILAGVATFGYFGGYWYQYWVQVRQTAKAPERKHYREPRSAEKLGLTGDGE